MYRQSDRHSRTRPGAGLAGLLIIVALSGCTQPSTPPAAPTGLPAAGTDAPTLEPTTTTPAPAATAAQTVTAVPATVVPPSPAPPTATPLPSATPEASAQYRLVFEATWSAGTHPQDFPPTPHFSGLIGALHSPGVHLWAAGEAATPGIKNMAETGAKSPLDREIEALIGDGLACGAISGGGIDPSPGVVEVTLTVNQDCPLVSVVSMIAPSPDWFVGVSDLSLLEDGVWVEQAVVELLPYDAGTDSGPGYTSPDEPTASAEAIYLIEAGPLLINGGVPPLGTFTFSRLDG